MSDPNNPAKMIAQEVFRISGQKITEDDPIIALILYVEQMQAIQLQKVIDHEENFFINLDKRFNQVNEIYEALELQKNQIRLDLVNHTHRICQQEIDKGLPRVIQALKKKSDFFFGGAFVLILILQIFILARIL